MGAGLHMRCPGMLADFKNGSKAITTTATIQLNELMRRGPGGAVNADAPGGDNKGHTVGEGVLMGPATKMLERWRIQSTRTTSALFHSDRLIERERGRRANGIK